MKQFFCLMALAMLTACASHPDKIDAAYVSPVKYDGYSCEQIAVEMDNIGRRTNDLYQRLKNERSKDNWQMGIGLVLFWPTLFLLEGGDGPEAAEYARLKGEFEALRQNSVKKSCGIEAQSPEEIIEQVSESEKDDTQAALEETDSQEKYRKQVRVIAESMECTQSATLVSTGAESEKWLLECEGGDVIEVRCFDEACYRNDKKVEP
jgi:hypothetical protein